LLVGGIKNVLDVYMRVTSISKMLANKPTSKPHTMNDAPLLPKEGVMETLEDVLVVLIGSDVICANEEIK